MRRSDLVVVGIGLLGLGACATTATPSSPPVPPRTVAFQCTDGARLSLAFAGRSATLSADGTAPVSLAQRPAASGTWYEGGGHTVRGKGDDIDWTAPGATTRQCTSASLRPGAAAAGLAGSNWQLVQFRSSDDAIGTIKPADATRYSLSFGGDGRLAAKLDCNRATARWQATPTETGGTLTLSPGAMTRAMCRPGSMDTRIARDFARIRSYTLVADTLNLALEADGGIYTWRRLP